MTMSISLYSATLKCLVMLPWKCLLTVLIWAFKNSPYSAQLQTWHVRETWLNYHEIWEQWNLKPFFESETFTNTGVKDKETSQLMSQSPYGPAPLLIWRCIMNQMTCHSAVSSAWLSAAWDLSTNINIPFWMTLTTLGTKPHADIPFSSKTTLFTEKRENWGN